MPASKSNPLFTRSEKSRVRKKIRHKIKGAARKGFAKLFGIPLSPGLGGKTTSRRTPRQEKPLSIPSTSVRAEVISALRNEGYNFVDAKRMVPVEKPGEDFDSLFRRAIRKNPAELIIFGNPERVYTRKNVVNAARAGNPIPAALLAGFESALGSIGASAITSTKSHRGVRKAAQRKKGRRNPDAIGKAEELFETFHHRGSSGMFETQRSAKSRKDFTSLGPLVAIGINAEKYDECRRAMGKKDFEQYKVEHWDKLPHLAFLTGPQVNQVKRILEEPEKLYAKDCPQLASSPNGKQLYAITPDGVEIDLRQFDTDASKDFIDLGEATFVVYIAKKPDTPLEWVHELGEDGGVRPRLVLNRLGKKELFFVGGSYTVEGPGIMH
jgi:hypothetical protein